MPDSTEVPLPPPATPPEESQPVEPKSLQRLPFPPYVAILTAVTTAAFLFALTRMPAAVGIGVTYDRATRALTRGDSRSAEAGFKTVVAKFPGATDVRIDLAQASLQSQDYAECLQQLLYFEGREVSKEQSDRLDQISNQIAEQPAQDERPK